jgi:transcription factor Dp-1
VTGGSGGDWVWKMTGLENLVSRNERLYHGTNSVPAGGVTLPFILVQTQPQATVEVEISEDMQVVHFDFNSTPFELHDDAYVLKALSLQEHQGAKSTEVMGRRGFDDGLGCKFEEDSSPLSSIFQHSSFPPRTSPYYPMSMPSVAKGSLGMLQVSSSRVKQENLS